MMSHELADAWRKRGHDVRVVMITPLDGTTELENLKVVRHPSSVVFWDLLQWSDVFVQNGISLRSLEPALLARRPLLFIHHNILKPGPEHLGVRNQLKRLATYLGHNAVISQPMADSIPGMKRLPHHRTNPALWKRLLVLFLRVQLLSPRPVQDRRIPCHLNPSNAMAAKTLDQRIESRPGVLGGKPCIAGRRIAVEHIAVWHEWLGRSTDEIASEYDLELADVYAALAYYFAHREEIDRSIQEGKDFVRRIREQTPSLLEEKLGRSAGAP